MNRLFLVSALLVCSLGMWAQGVVRGKVLDKQNDEVLQFVTVRVTGADGKLAGGGMTDVKGQFNIQGLKDGAYTLEITLMGYKSAVRRFQVTPEKRNIHYNAMKIVPGYADASPIMRTDIMRAVVDKIAVAKGRNFEHIDIYTYAKYFFYELNRRKLLGELIIHPHYCPEVIKHVKLESVLYVTRVWPEGIKEERPVHLNYTHTTVGGYKMTHSFDAFDIWTLFAGGLYKGEEE